MQGKATYGDKCLSILVICSLIMKIIKLTVSISFLLFYGCSRTIQCQDPEVDPVFIGYTKTQLNGILIKKYTENGNFQHLIDSFKVDTLTTFYEVRNDTISFSTGLNTERRIKSGFDWELFVPSLNKTYRFSDYNRNSKEEKCGLFAFDGCYCDNDLYSLRVNGQLVTPSKPYSRYLFYLR